jgi:hypothetical protein
LSATSVLYSRYSGTKREWEMQILKNCSEQVSTMARLSEINPVLDTSVRSLTMLTHAHTMLWPTQCILLMWDSTQKISMYEVPQKFLSTVILYWRIYWDLSENGRELHTSNAQWTATVSLYRGVRGPV